MATAALTCIAWAFLPGTANAPTGTIAQKAFGVTCNKNANKGQWECTLTNPVSLTDGSAIFMTGPGVPSDNNSGVIASIGDNGLGAFELTIRDVGTGGAPSDQSYSFSVWQLPRLT